MKFCGFNQTSLESPSCLVRVIAQALFGADQVLNPRSDAYTLSSFKSRKLHLQMGN